MEYSYVCYELYDNDSWGVQGQLYDDKRVLHDRRRRLSRLPTKLCIICTPELSTIYVYMRSKYY